jgi:hypothetical protein
LLLNRLKAPGGEHELFIPAAWFLCIEYANGMQPISQKEKEKGLPLAHNKNHAESRLIWVIPADKDMVHAFQIDLDTP